MPIVLVKMYEGKTMDQKRNLVEGITKLVTDVLDTERSAVRVLFDEYPKDNWAIAGEIVSDTENKQRK